MSVAESEFEGWVLEMLAEIKAEGESVYSATKAGVQAFAETLRKEVAGMNIKVSVVPQPAAAWAGRSTGAAVANDQMLHAEEVADAIVWVLTRSPRTDVVDLRIEPRVQKTS